MADDKKVEITVERVGDKLTFRLDPDLVKPGGACSNCNSNHVVQMEDLARAANSLGSQSSAKK
jgi:hypothetical protein